MEEILKNISNCKLYALSPDHKHTNWQSKKTSESDKYSWVDYNSITDDYEWRLKEVDYYKGSNLEDVTSTQKCIDFLTVQIKALNTNEQIDAQNLLGLYQDLLENRQSYLEPAKLMASTEINKANRAKYIELVGAKVSLTEPLEVIFFEIRKLIDYSYRGSVQVFIERCPDAFSFGSTNQVIDGSVLLTNTNGISETVDITVRYKDDDGVLVGDSSIYETIPGNSKVRKVISGEGSSGPVSGGNNFPAVCTISFN